MAKKKKKPKRVSQRWKLYEKSGEGLIKKNKECPKCGAGVFMGNHKNRWTCGKCAYTEFKKKE